MTEAHGNAVLRGGSLPESSGGELVVTVENVDDTSQVLKFDRGTHHDHYLPTDEWLQKAGRSVRVFAWSHCTRVAE